MCIFANTLVASLSLCSKNGRITRPLQSTPRTIDIFASINGLSTGTNGPNLLQNFPELNRANLEWLLLGRNVYDIVARVNAVLFLNSGPTCDSLDKLLTFILHACFYQPAPKTALSHRLISCGSFWIVCPQLHGQCLQVAKMRAKSWRRN